MIKRRSALTEEDAYRAALFLKQGILSPSELAKRLFPNDYNSGGRFRAAAKVRAHRAVRLAFQRNILRLDCLPHDEVQQELEAKLKAYPDCRITVVPDHDLPGELHPLTPVAAKAASVIAERIERLLESRKGPEGAHEGPKVFVGNAGGGTLHRVVQSLRGETMATDENLQRLTFVSLNCARHPDEMHISANFLAIRMAELYGGSHIARLREWPKPTEIKNAYKKALERLDLLLTSVGTRSGFLLRWFQRNYGPPPDEVLGDVALWPIDGSGREVSLGTKADDEREKYFKPFPDLKRLYELARDDKVVVVCAPSPYPPYPSERRTLTRQAVHEKAMLGKVILKHGLSSHFITSTTIARAISSEWETP